jgi:YggT family protein
VIGLSPAGLLHSAFEAYYLILIIRAILSWMPGTRRSPAFVNFARTIYLLTEPLLAPIRRALRPYMGGSPIDFSIIILWLILGVAEQVLARVLY